MTQRIGRIIFSLAFSIFIIGSTLPAEAGKPPRPKTLEVCLDGTCTYPTIQGAIDAADEAAGDNVLVHDGTYYEKIAIDKAIRVSSVNGAQDVATGLPLTVIDAQGAGGYVVSISADAELDGFTIQGGYNVEGGGIHIGPPAPSYPNLSPIIMNCVIANNESTQYGGGIYYVGDYTIPHARLEITNCVIHSNIAAGNGTAIMARHADIVVTNSTIADNSGTTSNYSAAIFVWNSSLTMVNSELWYNKAMFSGGVFDIHYTSATAPLDLTYSNIETGALFTGVGIISAPPLFVGGGDYRHQDGSPGIDEGTGDGAPAADLLGKVRPQDGDGDGTSVTDMGAYEFPAATSGITIIKALYDYLGDTLEVEASSEHGAAADLYLQLDTQRPMSWDKKSDTWKISEPGVTPAPAGFPVCGPLDSCTTVD